MKTLESGMENNWELISTMLESVIDEKTRVKSTFCFKIYFKYNEKYSPRSAIRGRVISALSNMQFVNECRFQIGSLRHSPYPLLGDDDNKVSSAYAEDLKTVGYGRIDSRKYPNYNNTFDPRLCFQGLDGCIFQHAVKEDDDLTKAKLTENVFLALDNPSAVMDDYLFGYREYLKNLTSLPTIYMGSGDDPSDTVTDDGSEECKRLFQRIRSQSVKSIFPKENNVPKYPISREFKEEKIKSECKPSTPHTQHHNQSDKSEQDQICLSPSATHSKEKVSATIIKWAEEGKRMNGCYLISNEHVQKSQVPSDLSSSGCENTFVVGTTTLKAEHFTEDSKEKIISQNSPSLIKDASSKNGRPILQKEVEKHLQEAMVKHRPGKMYNEESPDSHVPVQKPKVEKRREQLKAKKLKDLSEKQLSQPVVGKKATQTSKDHCTLSNASWAEKLFHNVTSEKEDFKERKSGNGKSVMTENAATTITSNLRPTSEPFTPPSSITLQTQNTAPFLQEEFQPRQHSQHLTTPAQSNNFLSSVQPAPYQQLLPPQSMYNVPINMPPPLVHNWVQFNAHQNFPRPQEFFQNTKWFNDNSNTHPLDYQQSLQNPITLNPIDQFVPSVIQNNQTCGQNYGYNHVTGNLHSIGNVLQSHNSISNVPPQYTFSQHRFSPSIYQRNDPPRHLYGFREFRNSFPYTYKNNSTDDNNNNNNNNSLMTDFGHDCPDVGMDIPRIQFRRSRSCEELDSEGSRVKHKPRAIRSNLIRIYPNND